MSGKTCQILLVEDNPSDVRLTRDAFSTSKARSVLTVIKDGVEAMDFLHKGGGHADAARPDLIFLDLNLPRKDGREVLSEIKADEDLKRIPVVILTTSRAESDIVASYDLNANCYIVKPANVDQFFEAIHSAEHFWLTTATRSPR
jgi:two-component system, chemotaxis family, response regulator Rcp1